MQPRANPHGMSRQNDSFSLSSTGGSLMLSFKLIFGIKSIFSDEPSVCIVCTAA